MPLYPPAVKKLLPLDTNMDPAIKARVVILHVSAGNATSLYDYFNGPSGGVESHFYIRKDGTVEQYRDTDYQADANVMANGFAVSIETQGLADGTWTDQQLSAIKDLLAWLHTVENIPLTVPKTWDGTGVGYHILFEDQWDKRHASCPGPNRIKQFENVLVPWMVAGGQDDTMSQAEVDQIKDYVKALVVEGYSIAGVAKPSVVTRLAALQKDVDALPTAEQIAAAVVAKLPAGTVDVPTLAKAVANELGTRILGKA